MDNPYNLKQRRSLGEQDVEERKDDSPDFEEIERQDVDSDDEPVGSAQKAKQNA